MFALCISLYSKPSIPLDLNMYFFIINIIKKAQITKYKTDQTEIAEALLF